MMRRFLTIILFLSFTLSGLLSAQNLSFYFPDEIKQLNPDIPSPREFLGFEVGEQYISYDQTVSYLRLLAQRSDRIDIIENGYSHERKPLIFLVVSSKKNLERSEFIRKQHLDLCNPVKSLKLSVDTLPIVTWMGYSIHGNEATGVNASIVVAYILAAGEDEFIKRILDNNVILIQPAQNPDGVQRYAAWVNSNKSASENSDANTREFKEPAPSSRSNHYWFDLNRDWLFVQNPESYYRMEVYYNWLPTFVNDFHEHGNTSGTYFSPGIKNSTNHLIPDDNWDISRKIADYHTKTLSKIGTMYYSREGYDDYYTGKGAALPDILGGVGLLYEQPNPRGFVREVDGVKIRFADMIKNQVFCSFSALEASVEMKNELLNYQKRFFIQKQKEAQKDEVKGYLFGSSDDLSLTKELVRILKVHKIDIFRLSKDLSINKKNFKKESAYIIPVNQNNYSVIRTIFEKTTTYKDSSFYDISTWTIPLGLNIQYSELNDLSTLIGEKLVSEIFSESDSVPLTHYAYLFEITDFYAYKFLYYLQSKGVKLKVSDSPFSINRGEKRYEFNTGTVLISVNEQSMGKEELNQILNNNISANKIDVLAVDNGTGDDFDLGSGHFKPVTKPKIALLTGKGAAYSIIGELWHLIDLRFGMPVSLIDVDNLATIDIDAYNIIVITNNFRLSKEAADKLSYWANSNTLIGIGTSYKTLNELNISEINITKSITKEESKKDGSFYDYIKRDNSSSINGVILSSILDMSNPLSYGLRAKEIPLFKEGEIIITNSKRGYITPLIYSENPLMSGYLSANYSSQIKGTPAVLAGKGLIYFVDDPYFRAIWLGSSRLFMNAIFFRELLAKEKLLTEK